MKSSNKLQLHVCVIATIVLVLRTVSVHSINHLLHQCRLYERKPHSIGSKASALKSISFSTNVNCLFEIRGGSGRSGGYGSDVGKRGLNDYEYNSNANDIDYSRDEKESYHEEDYYGQQQERDMYGERYYDDKNDYERYSPKVSNLLMYIVILHFIRFCSVKVFVFSFKFYL